MMLSKVFKRNFVHLPSTMKCMKIERYADNVKDLNATFDTVCPSEKDIEPDQALVKVCAASINPFDLEMSRGYGRNLINVLRNCKNVGEFPLVLGRDCSGIIVKRGKRFRRFQEGDKIYCARWVVGQGTHAEYVVVNKTELSLQPTALSDVEAASLPYVACTTWNALINSGSVPITGQQQLRIFIPGGTGGIGSFATQLCQAFGHDVITSCSTDGITKLKELNISNVLDYTVSTFEDNLKEAGPFDVILDTLNEENINLFRSVLKQNASSKYISLRPSLLPDTDKQGVPMGLVDSGIKYFKSTAAQLSSGQGLYHWGFFKPDGIILDNIKALVEDGKIKPFIDKVFSLDHILDAYEYVEKEHARGKTIIKMV